MPMMRIFNFLVLYFSIKIIHLRCLYVIKNVISLLESPHFHTLLDLEKLILDMVGIEQRICVCS